MTKRLLIPRAYVRQDGQIELVTDHPTLGGGSCFDENPEGLNILLNPARLEKSLIGKCSLCLATIEVPLSHFHDQKTYCWFDCVAVMTIMKDHRTPEGESCWSLEYEPQKPREFIVEQVLEDAVLGRCRKCRAPLVHPNNQGYGNV